MHPSNLLRRVLFGTTVFGLDQLKRHSLEVGDRFYEARPPHATWTIERFVRPSNCEIPHVLVQRVGMLPESKIISVAVLMDRDSFRPDRRNPVEAEDQEDGENLKRRASDQPEPVDADSDLPPLVSGQK